MNDVCDLIEFIFSKPVSLASLYQAIEAGSLSQVNYLLQHGIKPDEKSIRLAVRLGHLNIVVRIGTRDANKLSVLAAENGHVDIVKYLIEEKGADPCYDESEGFWLAAIGNHRKVAEYLYDTQDPDIANRLIADMIQRNLYDMIDFTLSKGANINNPDLKDYINNVAMIKYLESRGMVFTSFDAILAKAISRFNGNTEMIEYLLDRGADKTKALRVACIQRKINIVKMLVQRGANIHIDNLFSDALDDVNIVKFLVSKGLKLTGDNLKLAADNYRVEMVVYLLDQGIDIHYDDDYAIHVAYEHCYENLIKLLVKRGANFRKELDYGISKAKQNRFQSLVDYLTQLKERSNYSTD